MTFEVRVSDVFFAGSFEQGIPTRVYTVEANDEAHVRELWEAAKKNDKELRPFSLTSITPKPESTNA